MSFYTSIIFYRPTAPPPIYPRDLAAFLRGFAQTGVTNNAPDLPCEIKFGQAIDQDDKPTSWEEPIPGASNLFHVRSIDWDMTIPAQPLAELADALETQDRALYRVSVPLGMLNEPLLQRFGRLPTEEDSEGLALCDCRLSFEPILLLNSSSEVSYLGGWLGLSLSGPGQLWPWSSREIVQKAESDPTLQRMQALCRTLWPVPPGLCPPAAVEVRKEMGTLWPYVDLDRPLDWYWAPRNG